MSWDLQDLGAHLREKHHFQGQWERYLPTNQAEREVVHAQDHAIPLGMGHEHDPHDPRIIKEV